MKFNLLHEEAPYSVDSKVDVEYEDGCLVLHGIDTGTGCQKLFNSDSHEYGCRLNKASTEKFLKSLGGCDTDENIESRMRTEFSGLSGFSRFRLFCRQNGIAVTR